jgi:hypothetical protein
VSSNPAHQLASLVWGAVHSPQSADANALLVSADALLNLIRPGDLNPEVTAAARTLAHAACDWSVFGGDEYRLK